MTLLFTALALGQAAPTTPQAGVKAVSELLTVKAENLDLRMAMLQSEAERLQAERERLRVQACGEAGYSQKCVVDWRSKKVSEAAPEKAAVKK